MLAESSHGGRPVIRHAVVVHDASCDQGLTALENVRVPLGLASITRGGMDRLNHNEEYDTCGRVGRLTLNGR